MSEDTTYPEPADHGRTIGVGEYELAPGAKLSRASMGPVGAGEYSSFIVMDVDPAADELELYRVTDGARRTVTAAGLAGDIGMSTFVIDTGVENEDENGGEEDES